MHDVGGLCVCKKTEIKISVSDDTVLHGEASGITPQLLCGSSSAGAMRLEVGIASRKLTAW